MTTSLRGGLIFNLTVDVLTEGVHSGDASGIVPDSFRIIRELLNRIEDPKTGKCHQAFTVNIPPVRYQEAMEAYEKVPEGVNRFPLLKGI